MKKRKKKKTRIFIILIVLLAILLNMKTLIKMAYPFKYSDNIIKYSKEYDLNPYLVTAVIKVESDFDKNAKSKKGARGLMQITPPTAEWVSKKMKIRSFNKDMLYDYEMNIKMGCWYLDNLRNEFGSDMKLVLAAYNGGRGNVKKWLNNKENSKDGVSLDYIPFKETDEYVKKVEVNYKIYNALYSKDKEYVKAIKLIISSYFS